MAKKLYDLNDPSTWTINPQIGVAQPQQGIELKKDPFLIEGASYFEPRTEAGLWREGYSKYDQGMPISELNDIGEYRAQRQSNADKWVNAGGKMLLTAGTTFLDGTLGTVWGLGEMLSGGSFVDNAFSNAMADISEWSEKVLPNYYTKEEIKSPWYTNLGTANFWADKFMKNLGFTIGAVYSGMAWSGAASAALNTGKVARKVAQGVAKKHFAGNLEQAFKALKSGKFVGSLEGELLKDAKTLHTLNGVQQVVGALSGAVGESRIESISNARDFEQRHIDLLDQSLPERIPQWEQEGISQGLVGDGLTAYVDGKYNEEKLKLKDAVDAYRNINFLMDVAVLTAGNYAQFKKAFGGGYDVQRRTLKNVIKKPLEGYAGLNTLEREIPKGFLGKSLEVLKTTGKIAKNNVWEGLEELSQGVVKETGDEFFKAKLDPNATDTVNNYFSILADQAIEHATTPDKWEEFFIGFLTGGLGAPIMKKGGGVQMTGGIYEAMAEARSENKYTDDIIKKWNEFVTSDRFQTNYLGLVRDMSFQQQKDNALEKGDILDYKNAEHNQFINDALTAIKADRFDELIDFYENLGTGTDPEMFRDMMKVKKDKNGMEIPANERKGAFDSTTDSEIKSYLIERGRKLAEQAKRIRDISDALDIKLPNNTTNGVKETLIYYMSTIDNVEARLKDIKQELSKENSTIAAGLDALIDDMVASDGEPSKAGAEIQENLNKAINEYVKKNPSATVDVKQLVKDALALTKRSTAFVTYYNDAITSQGQKKMLEYQLNTMNEVGKLNNVIAENAETIKQAQLLKNAQLKYIFERTYKKEQSPEIEGQVGTREFKGEVELTVKVGDETRTDTYTVERVDSATGELVLKDSKGKEISIGATTENIEGRDQVVGGYVKSTEKGIDTWVDISIVKTADQVKQQAVQNAVAEAYRAQLDRRVDRLRKLQDSLRGFNAIQKRISEKAYAAIDNKTGKTRIVLGTKDQQKSRKEIEDILSKAGLDIDIANKASLTVNLVQLNAMYKALETMKNESQKELDEIQSEIDQIQKTIETTTIDSLERTLELLGELKDSTQNAVNEIVDGQNILQKLIKNIKNYLKGLDTRLENLKIKKEGTPGSTVNIKSTVNRLKELLDSDAFEDITEDPTILEDLMQEIKYLQDKRIPEATRKLEGYEQKLEELQKELKLLTPKLEAVNKSIGEKQKILDAINQEYYKGFDFGKSSVAGEGLLDKHDTENTEETFEYNPPRQPFTGSISDLMRTTSSQVDYTNEVFTKGDNTFEPELLFQDFITTYKIVEESDPNYKYLQAFSLSNFLKLHGDKLTSRQRTRMQQDASNFPEAIMVVVSNKDGSLYTTKPLITEADKESSLVYTKINGIQKDEKGNVKNSRESQFEMVDKAAILKHHPDFTEEQIEDIWQTIAKGYYNSVVKPVLNSETPIRFEIEKKNSGKKTHVKGEALENILDVLGVENYSDVELTVAINESTLGQATKQGAVYFNMDGELVKANKSTLREQDINNVVELLQLAFVSGDMSKIWNILQTIDSITYFKREQEGRKNSDRFNFYIRTRGTGNKAIPDAVVFGEHGIIKREQLLDPTKNEELIDQLKNFLSTKYYQVRSKDLLAPSFTSRKAKLTVENGTIKSGELINDVVYSAEQGGYKAYLMEKGNEKIMAAEKIMQNTPEERLKKPARLNRSFSFSLYGGVETQANNAPKNVQPIEVEDKNIQDQIDAEQFNISDPADFEGEIKVWNGEKVEEPKSPEISKVEYTEEEKSLYREMGFTDAQIQAMENGTFDSNNDSDFRLKRTGDTPMQFEDELKEFRKMFPDAVVRLINSNMAEVDATFVSTKNAAGVLLSEGAGTGTLFHEAFHMVSQLFTTKEERGKLYQEVRDRLGNTVVETQEGGTSTNLVNVAGRDMTDAQAEEYLAEEFRNFMLTGKDRYKFPAKSVKKNIFIRLWEAIKRLVIPSKNWIQPVDRIEEIFNEISTSTYNMQDRINFEYRRLNRVGTLTEKTANIYMKSLNYQFFSTLNSFPTAEKYNNVSKTAGIIYKTVYNKLVESSKKDKTLIPMLKNWDALKNKHINYLKQYQITLDDEQLLSENEEVEQVKNTRDNASMTESNKINVKESLPAPLKLLIAGLPRMKYGIDPATKGKIPIYDTVFGRKQTVDYGRTLNTLSKNLANLSTIEEMIEVMSNLAENNNPELSIMLDRMGIKDGKPFAKHITSEQFELQVAFFIAFHKSINDYVTIAINPQGDLYLLSNEDENNNRKLRDAWKVNAKNNLKKYSGLLKQDGDKLIINKGYEVNVNGAKVLIKNITSKKLKELSSGNKNTEIALNKMVLSLLGIEVSPQINNKKLLNNAVDFIFGQLSTAGENITTDDVYNRDIIKANKELKLLVQEESKYNPVLTDLQILVSGGQVEYSLMNKNRIAKVIDLLNENTVPESMEPMDKQGKGNIGTLNSKWLAHSKRSNKIEKVIIRNVGEDTSDKDDISEASPADFIRAEFNSVLEGVFPFIRSAERRLEYGFDFGKNYIETSIDRTRIKNDLKDYLLAEIVEAIAIANDSNAKQLLKRNRHSTLGFFKDIVPEVGNAIPRNLKNRIKPGNYLTVAQRLMEDFKGTIDNALDSYILAIRKNTIDLLRKESIASITKDGAIMMGINPELLHKFTNSNSPAVSTKDLNQMVDVFNHYYIQSLIEQSKLIFGSPLVYFNATKNTSDLHKRTTTFASTISGAVTGDAFNFYMNENFKRIDEFEHSDIRKEITIQDLNVDSHPTLFDAMKSILKVPKYYNAYKGMTKNDGQGMAFPDGYRSFAIRTSQWGTEQEKSWQYSMQVAGAKFVELGMWDQEKFNRIFSGHLPANPIKGWAYFRGKPIGVEGLIPLTNLKSQGTGQIQNEGLQKFNAIDITKHSITLLNPIDFLNDVDMLHFISAYMEQGIDFINPVSVKKGEIIAKEDGNVTNIFTDKGVTTSPFAITELEWSAIGNQLDIDPSGKEKVTMSTQMRRVLFMDAFVNGKIKNTHKQLESVHKEYNAIQRELVERALDKVVGDLGLTEGKENEFKLTNSKKFFDTIREQFQARAMPTNIDEGLAMVMEANNKVFDTIPTKMQVVNALQGLIRNKVVSLKVNGDMLIQESAAMYESPTPSVEGDSTLKFYMPLDAEGNVTTDIKKAVTMSAAEVMIPLPKKWIDYVNKDFTGLNFEEKLQKFNESIKNPEWMKNNPGFEELLTIVANRIPTSNLNTVEVFKIVKFLHPLGGSKIVLPTEIVAKSGSDFDIDKLTTYFNNVHFSKQGKPKYFRYNVELRLKNEKEALENRLNQLTIQIALDPANAFTLLKPNNSEIIKEQGKAVGKDMEKDTKMHNQFEFFYNSNVAKYQWGANRLVATGAINAVSHAITQSNPIKIDDEVVQLLFDSYYDNNEELFMGHYDDMEGNIISDTNDAILVGAVDAGKETFPNIFKINLTPATANAYFFLNRVGNAANKPMGFRFLTEFFTQPIILDYENRRRSQESSWLKVNSKQESKKDTLAALYTKYGITTPKKFLYEFMQDFVKADDANRADARAKLIAVLNNMKNNLGTLSNTNMGNKPSVVMEYYLYYMELGKLLGQFHTATRPDSGLTKDTNTVRLRERKLDRLNKLGIFDAESVKKLFDNSYIGAYRDIHRKSRHMFKDMFILEKYPQLDNFLWGENGIITSFENPVLSLPEDKLVGIIYKLQNATMAYILQRTPINGKKATEAIKSMFIGDNSFAKRLNDIKSKVKDNIALDEMIGMINEFSSRSQKNISIDFVKLFNKKMSVEESNSFTESIRELFESPLKEVQDFATDLITMSILQSGVQRSPISFFELLPAQQYHGVLSNIIDNFVNVGNMQLGEGAKDIIFRNLNWDSNIVPRQKEHYWAFDRNLGRAILQSRINKKGNLTISTGSQNALYDYLVVDRETVSTAESKKLKAEGKKVPKEQFLFKRSDIGEKITTFVPIGKLGMGMRLFEATVSSVVKGNNVGATTTVTTTKATNKTTTKTKEISPTIEDFIKASKNKYKEC